MGYKRAGHLTLRTAFFPSRILAFLNHAFKNHDRKPNSPSDFLSSERRAKPHRAVTAVITALTRTKPVSTVDPALGQITQLPGPRQLTESTRRPKAHSVHQRHRRRAGSSREHIPHQVLTRNNVPPLWHRLGAIGIQPRHLIKDSRGRHERRHHRDSDRCARTLAIALHSPPEAEVLRGYEDVERRLRRYEAGLRGCGGQSACRSSALRFCWRGGCWLWCRRGSRWLG